jgi:two-component system, OmpR family, response regulator VicR
MKKILLIDKDEFYLKVFKYKLEKSGDFEVHTFSSGNNAEQEIAKINPDLVFMELVLPGIDGFEIIKKLRDKFRFVVVSQLQGEKDKELAREMGAKAFLSKEGIPTNTIMKTALEFLK